MGIKYIKHSYNRKEKYQIKTLIRDSKVEKHPVYAEGFAHIKKISQNYNILKAAYNNISICNNELFDNHIEFEYIKGQTLSERLLKITEFYNKGLLLEEISKILEKIHYLSSKAPFEITEEFENVFGVKCKELLSSCKLESFLHSNIDTNFDNIIVSDEDNEWYMVDYEWVYSFPVPIRFIQFRSLLYFYTTNAMVLQEFILFDEILNYFGFENNEIEAYSDMDNNFIHCISDKGNFLDNFAKKSINLDLQAELTKTDITCYSQLYIVDNEGMINEKTSIVKNIILSGESNQNISLTYEGLNLLEIQGFRFDPLNQPGLIKVENVCLIQDQNSYPVPYIQMNAFLSEENGMLFITDDPQIYLDINNMKSEIVQKENKFTLSIKYIIIDFEITEKHKYFPFMKSYKEALEDRLVLNAKNFSDTQEIGLLRTGNEVLQEKLLQEQQKCISHLENEKRNMSDLQLKEKEIQELKGTIESMKFKNKIKKWIGR